jgi:hypothetical protein
MGHPHWSRIGEIIFFWVRDMIIGGLCRRAYEVFKYFCLGWQNSSFLETTLNICSSCYLDRTMAQVVSRRPLTAEARV